MGVIIRPSAPDLEPRVYLAGKRMGIETRSHAVSDSSSCGFDLFNCCYPIPQFVDLDDTEDQFKNDFFTFIFEKDSDSHVAITTITNNTTGQSEVFEDDTFGDFYDFEYWSARPLTSGWKLKWVDVVGDMSYGNYTVKVEIFTDDEPAELVSTELSICFQVMPFSCDSAHGTIRFETIQTGYIHNGFDYRDIFHTGSTGKSVLGWVQQIRVYGMLTPIVPDEENDFIQMSNRINTQVQQKLTDKYSIELYKLRSEFGKHLTNDNFLASQILVSDYNLNNYEVYRNKHLYKVSTDEIGSIRLNSGINPKFTFKEMDEGTVKRIYG